MDAAALVAQGGATAILIPAFIVLWKAYQGALSRIDQLQEKRHDDQQVAIPALEASARAAQSLIDEVRRQRMLDEVRERRQPE